MASKAAAPRVKVGADVLPWWPVRGVYLLLESGRDAHRRNCSTSTASAESGRRQSQSVDADLASAPAGQTITYCFLDDDPVATARRLRPLLRSAGATAGIEPLLAAPFHPVVPYEWDRYVP